VLAVRVDSVFMVWVVIELRLIIMAPLISSCYLNNNEALVKYFLIQRLRGLILLFRWVCPLIRAPLFILGACLKLGLTPLHH
jgi:hypothetical protein